jgi:hypothetical protein
MEWLIKRLIKVGAKVACHGRMWYTHVASAFPVARHYQTVLGYLATRSIVLDLKVCGEVGLSKEANRLFQLREACFWRETNYG